MTQLLTLNSPPPLSHHTHTPFTSTAALLCELFSRGNSESDPPQAVVVVVGKSPQTSGLDGLSYSDKALLLRHFFGHLNLIVVSESEGSSVVARVNTAAKTVATFLANRINRVSVWTGTGRDRVDDDYATVEPMMRAIPTMANVLSASTSRSAATTQRLVRLKNMMVAEIDFVSLLHNHSAAHLASLQRAVDRWAFPAHDLSNDDLVYCAYLMLASALDQVDGEKPSRNELLAFVFIVRDTYHNGNPFHNFRHAVDVVHACFHFLTRLGCVGTATGSTTTKSSESTSSENSTTEGSTTEGSTTTKSSESTSSESKSSESKSSESKSSESSSTETSSTTSSSPILTPLQTLGLLVAALGHDVGHPGVTNAFMIKHKAPTAAVYNERSVLESFHAAVFINKVLAVCWPALLTVRSGGLQLKDLIITSILATDMAEHFEYLNRLSVVRTDDATSYVKLLCSLLIKCADISNVSRPLTVSSQWAMVLAREFDEVVALEEMISTGKEPKDVAYDKVPKDLGGVLAACPQIHKGQIFFINTFAEKLFESVAELMGDVGYACEIIGENKRYWENHQNH